LRKNSNNAYNLELLNVFDISPIFNVDDLYEFHEGEENEEEGIVDEWNKQLPIKLVGELEKILAKRNNKKIQNKDYYEYLVKWRNRGFEDASWVVEKELTCL
jgi:hypothetical protein